MLRKSAGSQAPSRLGGSADPLTVLYQEPQRRYHRHSILYSRRCRRHNCHNRGNPAEKTPVEAGDRPWEQLEGLEYRRLLVCITYQVSSLLHFFSRSYRKKHIALSASSGAKFT